MFYAQRFPSRPLGRWMRSLLAASIVLSLLLSPILVAPALAALAADPGGPYKGVVGENVEFSGAGSTPGDDKIKYWFWDFGDGTAVKRDKNASISHKYAKPGTFTVRLRVVDDEGVSSPWAATTATIVDPNQTTTTTSTTTTTTPTTTTTTTAATTTTTAPTTTTSSTTTTAPTTTSSTTTTTAATTTTTRSPTTVTTQATTTTATPTTTKLEVLGQRIEITSPATGITAMLFLVAPPIVSPGDAITLDLELDAVIPGAATVLFLLDGETLGEPATTATGIRVSVTRTLPSDLSIGRHRVEMVSENDLNEVLASRTVDVVGAETEQVALPQPVTPAVTAPGTSLIVVLGVVVLAAVGAGAGWRYRRRWLPKRRRS